MITVRRRIFKYFQRTRPADWKMKKINLMLSFLGDFLYSFNEKGTSKDTYYVQRPLRLVNNYRTNLETKNIQVMKKHQFWCFISSTRNDLTRLFININFIVFHAFGFLIPKMFHWRTKS
jgi:hypothetical protein